MSNLEQQLNQKKENYDKMKQLVERGNKKIQAKKVKVRRGIESYLEQKELASIIGDVWGEL